MKIFVESHSILKNRSGVGWFAHGLAHGLQAHLGRGDSIHLLTHPQEPIDVGDLVQHPQTFEHPIDWLPGRVYHALKFRNLMPPVDLVYGQGLYIFPNFIRWPLAYAPSVTVIHDLSMFVCPEYSSPQNLAFMTRHLERSVMKSDLVIAVSHASKNTLCEHFPIDPDKVLVTYQAATASYYPRSQDEIAAIKGKYGIFGKYMLFVSNLEPRKNVEGIIAAYRMLPKKLRDEFSLVLAGGRGWRDDDIRNAITEARIAGDKVVLPGYVDEQDLAGLFTGAEVFLYPSHYEGFGIPILEAMSCGTPVITADNSSMPEAGGKAAVYVNSRDNDQLRDAMHELLTKPELRAKHSKAGLAHAKTFSWEKSSGSLLTSLRNHRLI